MLKQIKSEEKVNVNPKDFCKCFIDKLKEHNYYFINFQQNDVGEFMTILFDLLHKCLEYKVNMEYEGEIKHSYDKIAVESIKAWKSFFDSSYSYIVKKTYNQLLSITNCPECNYSTYNHVNMIKTIHGKAEKNLLQLEDIRKSASDTLSDLKENHIDMLYKLNKNHEDINNILKIKKEDHMDLMTTYYKNLKDKREEILDIIDFDNDL